MNEYEKQAKIFLAKHDAKIEIEFFNLGKYWDDDKEPRNIYKFTITRKGKAPYSAKFGDSIANTIRGEKPTAYDILACLTKNEPSGDIWDFANEYGYTIDSKETYNRVNKIFNAVNYEYRRVEYLFGDCMDELQEIY